MSKVFDALYEMKFKIAIWAAACLFTVIMFFITYMWFPHGLPSLLAAFVGLVFLGAFFGMFYLVIDFTRLSNTCIPVLRAKKSKDIDVLINYLNSPDVSARGEAIKAMAELRDPRAIEPLIDALRHDKVYGTLLASTLETYGEALAEPLLMKLSSSPIVSFDAGESSKSVAISVKSNTPSSEGWPLRVSYGPQTIKLLLGLLGSYENGVKTKAYAILKDFGRVADPTLLVTIDDPEYAQVRAKAIELLCEAINDDYLVYFIRASKDMDKNVRLAAVRALGMIDDIKSVQALESLKNDADSEVRELATIALDKLKARAFTPKPTASDHMQQSKTIMEKEIIREIVKVPCEYCGTLVDVTSVKCPICGAPFSPRH